MSRHCEKRIAAAPFRQIAWAGCPPVQYTRTLFAPPPSPPTEADRRRMMEAMRCISWVASLLQLFKAL